MKEEASQPPADLTGVGHGVRSQLGIPAQDKRASEAGVG